MLYYVLLNHFIKGSTMSKTTVFAVMFSAKNNGFEQELVTIFSNESAANDYCNMSNANPKKGTGRMGKFYVFPVVLDECFNGTSEHDFTIGALKCLNQALRAPNCFNVRPDIARYMVYTLAGDTAPIEFFVELPEALAFANTANHFVIFNIDACSHQV
jgi:hypothetical protein